MAVTIGRGAALTGEVKATAGAPCGGGERRRKMADGGGSVLHRQRGNRERLEAAAPAVCGARRQRVALPVALDLTLA
jgi:hypothetical protein